MYRHIKKVSHWQEESTSIFPDPVIKAVDEVKEVAKTEQLQTGKEPNEDVTDSVMWRRLRFLSTDFAKYVYKPLRFHLHNGDQIFGFVDQLFPSSVQIKSPGNEVIAVEIQEIQEIWWGGKILPVRF
ncbi:hypothetical protein [Paenisporosarcina indica]|uniref:hypothetical protein n=1 Tax=Paenisporosarcina indica TaxID=650093 RepID=UPI001FEA15A7|nr:hypothetical protein [Paenisporosarcina indica]